MEGTIVLIKAQILDFKRYSEIYGMFGREKNGNINGYTWCDATNTPKSGRDFIFASENL